MAKYSSVGEIWDAIHVISWLHQYPINLYVQIYVIDVTNERQYSNWFKNFEFIIYNLWIDLLLFLFVNCYKLWQPCNFHINLVNKIWLTKLICLTLFTYDGYIILFGRYEIGRYNVTLTYCQNYNGLKVIL